jgi:hypothetical protein
MLKKYTLEQLQGLHIFVGELIEAKRKQALKNTLAAIATYGFTKSELFPATPKDMPPEPEAGEKKPKKVRKVKPKTEATQEPTEELKEKVSKKTGRKSALELDTPPKDAPRAINNGRDPKFAPNPAGPGKATVKQPVVVNGIYYPSVMEAVRSSHHDPRTIKKICDSGKWPTLWYWADSRLN